MTQTDFPLPEVSRAALGRAMAQTQGEWGMCLVKGLPTERWSEDEARLAYWGMGLYIGTARTQNRASQFVVDVRNEGSDYKVRNGRGYNTNAGLEDHEALDLKRHLYRMWLAVPHSQPLPPQWEEYFGDARAGAVRGGLRGDNLAQDFIDFETRQARTLAMPLKPRTIAAEAPAIVEHLPA